MILFVKIKSVDHKRPFVKTKPVSRRCSFLSRSSQLIADTLLSRQSQLVADTPFVKIKLVGHRHPLLSKIKPFGRIRPFSSRSKQLIIDSSIIKIRMKKSQPYQLSRVISEFSNYQLSQILSFFVKRQGTSSIFQSFRFEGQVIFENSTSIKSWSLKLMSLFYIDTQFPSSINEGHSIDTRFCTHDLIKEGDWSDHPCTKKKIIIASHASFYSCITCVILPLHYMH